MHFAARETFKDMFVDLIQNSNDMSGLHGLAEYLRGVHEGNIVLCSPPRVSVGHSPSASSGAAEGNFLQNDSMFDNRCCFSGKHILATGNRRQFSKVEAE